MNSKEKKKTSDKTAMALVTEYGIKPDLIGCRYIAKAVELYSPETCNFNKIYSTVANAFSVSNKSVIRCISYAISNAYSLREKICKAFNIDIPKGELHSSLVIAYLSILWHKR